MRYNLPAAEQKYIVLQICITYGIPPGTQPGIVVLLHVVIPSMSYKLSLQQAISTSPRAHKVLFDGNTCSQMLAPMHTSTTSLGIDEEHCMLP